MKYYFALLLLVTQFTLYSQQDMVKDWANIKKYSTENESIMAPKNTSANVVFMGDSITEFWKVNDHNFFSSNNFINRGISGQTTPQMLLRFRQDVLNLKPSTVVILAGINDIAENTGPITLEQIMDNISSMVALAKANKIKVILCSVLPANKFNWNPKLQPADKVIELNQMIAAYADKNKITYVDYYKAMVDENKGLQKQFGEDGVHPNLDGYKVMEDLLLKSIL
ncbi:SGNH/GDSL hydrolase family protein [Flavobacterium sp.]|uniref:SGNH/GDSL hydrolase family protein n=1 Tax=Flavobacterium sp. TaxID=239 RepID=UPI002627E049|nr:SGNH/GDSL hydrolase family protein [Flavobacterium sp.]